VEEVHAPDQSKVYQSPGMVKSQSVGTICPPEKEGNQRGVSIDRGVGFPRLVKSSSSDAFTTNFNLDPGTKVCKNDFRCLFIIKTYLH